MVALACPSQTVTMSGSQNVGAVCACFGRTRVTFQCPCSRVVIQFTPCAYGFSRTCIWDNPALFFSTMHTASLEAQRIVVLVDIIRSVPKVRCSDFDRTSWDLAVIANREDSTFTIRGYRHLLWNTPELLAQTRELYSAQTIQAEPIAPPLPTVPPPPMFHTPSPPTALAPPLSAWTWSDTVVPATEPAAPPHPPRANTASVANTILTSCAPADTRVDMVHRRNASC